MVCRAEVDAEDVALLRRSDAAPHDCGGAAAETPAAPAPIAEHEAAVAERAKPDAETYAAMRWAIKLTNGAHVLNLIRDLPLAIIQEQVALYTKHKSNGTSQSAVAVHSSKFVIRDALNYKTKMTIAKLFHQFLRSRGTRHTRCRNLYRTSVGEQVDK